MMTIGGYVLFGVCSLVVLLIGSFVRSESYGKKSKNIATIVSILICVALFAGMYWFYNNTASGLRAFKSQDSQLGNGIERTIVVYDINGEEVEHFEGKFDVTYDSERILFDDQNGKRHVIYPGFGIVVVNEE